MSEPIYQNHVIDPTYFYDAIEEFAFNYIIYHKVDEVKDENFNVVSTYENSIIRGSLQSQGSKVSRSKRGNTNTHDYEFYCKSLYRIHIDDIIQYKNNFYIVNDIKDYDEWGVRQASLSLITLMDYRDFAEYLKYQEGEMLV